MSKETHTISATAPDLAVHAGPPGLDGCWQHGATLKQDVFSTIERGHLLVDGAWIPAVVRRIDQVPWWTALLSRAFLAREAAALARADSLGIAPRVLFRGPRVLVRSWVDGVALHVARPFDDRAYFRSAKQALRALHHVGVTHNDLAKEQNWLRGPDGRAYLTDFQLATRFARRSWVFRLAAHEDLRHLLKHKRRYVPSALTASEHRMLARKSWVARTWLVTGKRVYVWFTRGVLGFTDREGSGTRLVHDAPLFAAALERHPNVREAAVVPYPDRRIGTGLYAFVEADGIDEGSARNLMSAAEPKRQQPEHVQMVARLPRDADGRAHTQVLTLIAMNQLDLIDGVPLAPEDRAAAQQILAGRKNLRDRFNTA